MDLRLRILISFLIFTQHCLARSVARRCLPGRMKSFEKCDERRRFRRTQILSVSGHVASALEHLAYELIASQSNSDGVESRPALATDTVKRVAIVALLGLKDERALNLEGRCSVQQFRRYSSSGGSIHHGTPWRMVGQIGEGSQRYRDKKNCQHCYRTPFPAFFALA